MNPAAALIRHEEPLFFIFYRKSNATRQALSVFDCPFLGKNFDAFENIGNVRAIAKKVTFLFKFTSISCLFSFFKMYLEMNMSKYSSAKYSQVEDKAEFEENPAGRAAQARNRPIPAPRNLKWTSLRQPSNNQQGEIV